MKLEKRHLISELLDEEQNSRRAATLLAGRRILRRRRWRQMAVRGFAVIAIIGIAVLSLHRPVAPGPRLLTSDPKPSPEGVRSLTDDELLALFPDTPVALASLENGKKRLIFPRSGDEERFVSHL